MTSSHSHHLGTQDTIYAQHVLSFHVAEPDGLFDCTAAHEVGYCRLLQSRLDLFRRGLLFSEEVLADLNVQPSFCELLAQEVAIADGYKHFCSLPVYLEVHLLLFSI